MERACKQVARPDAAQRVADLVEEQRAWLTRIDLASGAARGPHRGHRRRGDERDRDRPRRDGPPRVGQRPQGRRASLERLRALGVDGRRRPRGRERRATSTSSPLSTAIPTSNPEVGRRPRARHPVVQPGRDPRGDRRDEARRSPSAGTHGKTTTSSMLSLVLIEAGLHPSFIVGGELNEIGTGAVWDAGATCSSSRPTRATARSSSCPPPRCCSPTSSPTTSSTTGRSRRCERAFARFLEQAPGPRVVCADDRLAASSPDATLCDHLRHERRGRLPHGRRLDRSRRACASPSARRATGRGRSRLPVPGLHNARNAAGALAMALELGATPEAAVRALGRYAGVARRFELRGRGRRRDVRRRVLAPAERGRGRDRSGAGGRLAPSRLRVPAAPLQPHRDPVAGLRRRVRRRRRARGHRRLLGGRGAAPGITGKLIVNAVLDAHPLQRVAWLPHRADLVTYLGAELRPGDLCLTWAPATSRRCPMSWSRSSR